MAKKVTPKKPIVLKEVKITASKPTKKPVEPTTRLYPKGEVKTRTADSLSKSGLPIGKPMVQKGVKPQYGARDSDLIKKALKKK